MTVSDRIDVDGITINAPRSCQVSFCKLCIESLYSRAKTQREHMTIHMNDRNDQRQDPKMKLGKSSAGGRNENVTTHVWKTPGWVSGREPGKTERERTKREQMEENAIKKSRRANGTIKFRPKKNGTGHPIIVVELNPKDWIHPTRKDQHRGF